jgi:hypothetical protein
MVWASGQLRFHINKTKIAAQAAYCVAKVGEVFMKSESHHQQNHICSAVRTFVYVLHYI